jgi:hypothetical protein
MWLKILTSGWTYAAVLLVLLVLSRLELAGAVIIHQQEKLNAAEASELRWAELIKAEREEVKKYYDISMKLEQEKDKIENEKDAVIADLRAGNVRLRQRFTCPTPAVPNSPTASGQRDGGEGSGLLEQDAEFLVRLAAEADERVTQLTACQNVLKEAGYDRQE